LIKCQGASITYGIISTNEQVEIRKRVFEIRRHMDAIVDLSRRQAAKPMVTNSTVWARAAKRVAMPCTTLAPPPPSGGYS